MALSFFNEIQIQIIREQCVFILFKVGSFHIVLLYELLCKSLNLLYLYLLIRFHCEILLHINFFYDSRNPIKHLQVLSYLNFHNVLKTSVQTMFVGMEIFFKDFKNEHNITCYAELIYTKYLIRKE